MLTITIVFCVCVRDGGDDDGHVVDVASHPEWDVGEHFPSLCAVEMGSFRTALTPPTHTTHTHAQPIMRAHI